MQLEQIIALVTQINEKYNQILANAKTIDELDEQVDLLLNSYVAVRVGGTTQKLQIQKIIDAVQTFAVNEVVSVGTITIDGNDVTIPAGAQWRINGVNLFSSEDTVINIPFAAPDKIRTDIIVANSGGSILKVTGTETDTGEIAVRPPIPFNTVLVTQVNVTETSFDTIVETIGEAPMDGNIYGRKDGGWEQIVGSGVTPTFQSVIEAGEEVVSDNGLKKMRIDKELAIVEIWTRATTSAEWILRSASSFSNYTVYNADGTNQTTLDFDGLKVGTSSYIGPTEYLNNKIISRPDDSAEENHYLLPNVIRTITPGGTDPIKLAVKPVVNAEDFTAQLGVLYETRGILTITDPSVDDAVGDEQYHYEVIVVGGTTTVGGEAYGAGRKLLRYYDGTSWITLVFVDKEYIDAEINNAVVGLLDDRGNYDASSNLFPSTGGSGSGGDIRKGDLWTVSVAGTLGGNSVTVGDVVRALVDTPGQTSSNWVVTENNIGYVPENNANKTDVMSGNTTSSTKFLSAKGVYDFVTGLVVSATSLVAGISKLYSGLGSNTDGSVTQKAITDELKTKVTFWSSGADGVTVANTLTITPTYSRLIPGGTFEAGDVVVIQSRATSPGAKTSASSLIAYVNETDDLLGATQIGILTSGATARTPQLKRTLSIKGSTTKVSVPVTTSFTDDTNASAAMASITIDWTVDQYIIFAISHTVADQTLTGDMYTIQKL